MGAREECEHGAPPPLQPNRPQQYGNGADVMSTFSAAGSGSGANSSSARISSQAGVPSPSPMTASAVSAMTDSVIRVSNVGRLVPLS